MGKGRTSGGRFWRFWPSLLVALCACGPSQLEPSPQPARRAEPLTAAPSAVCSTPPTFAGLAAVSNAKASTCQTQLTWAGATASCGGTITYSVYRSASSGFTPGPETRIATGLSGTSFVDDRNLQDNRSYWYVVRATEEAGATIEETNTVSRSAHVSGPNAPAIRYFDDLDGNRPANADAYWSTSDDGVFLLDGGEAAGAGTYASPTHSWQFGDRSACGGYYCPDQHSDLVLGGDGGTPGIDGFAMPSRVASAVVSFWDNGFIEDGYDYLNLRYSTEGADGTWTLFASWTGLLSPTSAALPASSLGGKKVWIDWQFLSDSIVQYAAWHLDDIRFDVDEETACTSNVPPPGSPAKLAVSGLPASVTAGTPVTVTLSALDPADVLVTGYAGTVSLASSDPLSTVPSPVSFTSGQATVQVTFKTAGAQSLTLVDSLDPQLAGAASTVVAPAAPAQLTVRSQPTSVTAGATFADPVAIDALDAYGNAVADGTALSIALSANPTGDSLNGTLTWGTSAGVATFSDLSLTLAGTGYQLTASVGGLTVTTAPIEVIAATPTALAWAVQPSQVRAGLGFAQAPEVAVVDAYGNLTAATPDVTVALSPNGSALTGTATQTASAGVARFADLGVTRAGTGYTLTATAAGLTSAVSSAFDVTAGPPHHLRFSVEPAHATAGAAISPTVAVTVFDAFDNLEDQPTPVRMALGSNPHGASLLGTTEQLSSAGVATFGDLAVDRAGEGYSLFASTSGATVANSIPFDVAAAAAAGLSFLGGPPPTIVAGAPFGLQVAVRDAFGNPNASGAPVTVSLSLQGGAGTLSGTTHADTVNGVATFSGLSVDQVGSGLTLQASGAGFLASSTPFAVVNAAASGLTVELGGPAQQGRPVTVTVTALDALGNPARDDQRTVRFTSSDPKAQLPAPVALYDGRAQASVVFGSSGAQTLTVTDAEDSSVVGSKEVSVAPVAAPVVTLLAPQEGATVSGQVQVIASASVGAGTSVTSLSILVDGQPLESGSSAVLSATWDTRRLDPGKSHQLVAKVVDQAGNSASSEALTVKVAAQDGGGCSAAGSGPAGALTLAMLLLAQFALRRRRGAAHAVGAAHRDAGMEG